MKTQNEAIAEFNKLVNMTAGELEKWLRFRDSNSAGRPKEDEGGETVGHGSGRKIVEMLKANPKKDPKKYTEDQAKQIQKVLSDYKQHLAQVAKSNADKPPEELKKTESYASPRNLGHDPLRDQEKTPEASSTCEETQAEGEDGGKEQRCPGHKRKLPQTRWASNKKKGTRQARSGSRGEGGTGSGNPAKNRAARDEQEDGAERGDGAHGRGLGSGEDGYDADATEDEALQSPTPKRGHKISWNRPRAQPKGKVLNIKGKKATVKTKNGGQVSQDGTAEDLNVIADA